MLLRRSHLQKQLQYPGSGRVLCLRLWVFPSWSQIPRGVFLSWSQIPRGGSFILEGIPHLSPSLMVHKWRIHHPIVASDSRPLETWRSPGSMITGNDDPLGLWGGASFPWPLVDAHFLLSGLWEMQRGADSRDFHFLGDSGLQSTGWKIRLLR